MNDLGQAAVSADKAPRTERGRRTARKLLEAAAQEFGAHLELACREPAMNEDLARFQRIQRTVMNAPPRHDGEPVQRHALVRHDHAAVLVPVRIEVVAGDQPRSQRLDPFGRDARDVSRVGLSRQLMIELLISRIVASLPPAPVLRTTLTRRADGSS